MAYVVLAELGAPMSRLPSRLHRHTFAAVLAVASLVILPAPSGPAVARNGTAPPVADGVAVVLAPTPITSGKAWDLAPRLRLYTTEDRNPLSPLTFIDNSDLGWSHDSDCTDHYYNRPLAESGLASGTYKERTTDGSCVHQSMLWASNDYTAVGETYDSPRPGGLEGFYLNLDNDLRDGGSFNEDEPVIVRSADNWIQYWYSFGDSQNRWGTGHEGDWEHIAIRLDSSNDPVEIEYSYHHSKCTLPWSDAPKYNGRPSVWLAKGSHGSYPAGGTPYSHGGVNDLINEGPLWNARANLVRLNDYLWSGYKGSWGTDHVGEDDFGPSSPGGWRGAPAFSASRCVGV